MSFIGCGKVIAVYRSKLVNINLNIKMPVFFCRIQVMENINGEEDVVCMNIQMKTLVLLEFLNGILLNCGKEPIDDPKEFKKVVRADILSDANIQLMENMYPTIFGPFSKAGCAFNRRQYIENYIVTLLRYMCSDIGLQFKSEFKWKYSKENKKRYCETHYSIVASDG